MTAGWVYDLWMAAVLAGAIVITLCLLWVFTVKDEVGKANRAVAEAMPPAAEPYPHSHVVTTEPYDWTGAPDVVEREDIGTDREPEWSKAYGRIITGIMDEELGR